MKVCKIICLLLLIIVFGNSLFSQTIQRHSFPGSGNSNSVTSLSLESNIGELMIDTYNSAGNMLTQGFIQNDQFGVSTNNIDFTVMYGNAYPNPVTSNLSIELNFIEANDIIIEVLDVLGKKYMITINNSFLNGKSFYELNFENMGSGIYFIQIKCPKKQFNQTFKISKI